MTGLGGLYLEGLIHGGAYFRKFTVNLLDTILSLLGHLSVFIYTGTNVVLRYVH